MGVLDELHVKVEEIRAEQLKQDLELAAQEAFYRESLRPVMVQALHYFSDLVEKLEIVKPEIRPAYPLNPLIKRPVKLRQSDYKVQADSENSPHQIDITCRCTLDRPLEFYLPGRDAASEHENLLKHYDLYHQCTKRIDKNFYEPRGATFYIEGPMFIRIRLVAQAADRCVRVIIRNIEQQALKRYTFPPEELNSDLLERLARLLLREEEALVELTVSDEYRQVLRRQIDEEKRRENKALGRYLAGLKSSGPQKGTTRQPNSVSKALAHCVDAVKGLVGQRQR